MASFRLFILCFLFAFSAGAQGIVTTLAGNGTAGYGADNIHGTQTSLRQYNEKVVVAPNGDIYFADSNRIRKIDPFSGIVTTIAGTDLGGYSGDGGPATNANFYRIIYLAFSPWGDLYLTDAYNNRVRKIDMQTGIVTTVAGTGVGSFGGDGGPATNAYLNIPYGIAFDRDSNLLITDIGNNRIRKVNATTGIITTIAGTGNTGSMGDGGPALYATIGYGGGICVDSANNIYVECFVENRVRKIDGATGIITTYAGTGLGPSNGDGFMATGANIVNTADIGIDKDGNLYIAEYDDNRIRKVNASTHIISTVIGTGAGGYNGEYIAANTALLNGPGKVTVDSCDNIYIADTKNHRVRRVTYDHCGELKVQSPAALSEFTLYPNPAYSELVVTGNGRIESVSVMDMSGRVLLKLSGNGEKLSVDVSGLPNGIYIVNAGGVLRKFVKM